MPLLLSLVENKQIKKFYVCSYLPKIHPRFQKFPNIG